MTILPVDPIANANPEALRAFLEACRERARKDARAKLVSISIAVDALDPLAVLESIFEPGEQHFYAERPSLETAIAGAEAVLTMEANGPERFAAVQRFVDETLAHTLAVGDVNAAFGGPHFFATFAFADQVEAGEPGNWAAHNNLAVILWQTRAQVPAMAQYEKAMLADPGNQRVLDNVTEALHQVTPALAKNEVVRRVAVRFMEQDTLLAAKMKQEKGLMRVGAQWVPAEEYETLATSRKDAEGKIAQYQKEAATLPNEIRGIDQDLAIKVSAMKDLEMRTTVVDIFGNTQANPLPGQYYQLKQEVEQMTADRVLKQRRLEQLPRLMGEAQKQLAGSQGRFTGKQGIVDSLDKTAAATQATTRPG